MPKSRLEFGQGEPVPTASLAIMHFLMANPEKAFSLQEIESGILGTNTKGDLAVAMIIGNVLDQLKGLGLVDARRIKNGDVQTIFYMLKEPVPV